MRMRMAVGCILMRCDIGSDGILRMRYGARRGKGHVRKGGLGVGRGRRGGVS